ncbi:MAG: hypothetical protein WC538_00620 [Thermoanaerobaculia bacterium]
MSLGPGPAALYRDACRFFDGLIAAETASHLAGHLQRELLSAVHDVLLPSDYADPQAGDDPKSTAAILRALELPSNTDVTKLRKALRAFFKPQGGGGITKVKIIANALGLPVEHEVVALSRELKLHAVAHRSGLDAPPTLESLRETWERLQRLLSLFLEHFEKSYASAYTKIRAAIAAHDLETFRTMVPQNFTTLSYFFERLEGDVWFDEIRRSDTFSALPPGGGWPALAYLARVAPNRSTDIRDILLAIPSTDNEFVLMGMIDTALRLPPADALLALQRIAPDVVALRADSFVPHDFMEAVGEYALTDPDLAFALIRPFLELHVADEPRGGYLGSRELTARVDLHTYSEIIEGPLAAVIAARPVATLASLVELLDAALREEYGTPPDDYSVAWRPAVEPHGQNHEYEPLPILFDAVRLAAERACSAEPENASDLIRDLFALRWTLFERLAIHLARVALPPTSSLVRKYVLDVQTLTNNEGRHEKHLLVAHAFPYLSNADRRTFVDAILKGTPEVDRDDELREARIKSWRLKRLTWIAEHLPEDARRVYEELRGDDDDLGPSADFDFYTTAMWVGPTSPKTTADFEAMPLPSLVDFLRTWVPPSGMMADTRDGVGRELAPAIEQRAEEISESAEQFIGLDPTFVRELLAGLTDAAKNRKALKWDPVLRLAAWAASQPREIAGRSRSDLDDDPNWGRTRSQIGRLLQQGFKKRETQIPSEFRSLVWEIIHPITADPDPDASRDEGNDPLTTAINSTRGVALEAAIGYAAWVRDGYFAPPDAGREPFHDMPELEALLASHLDPGVDPSPAVRAVYGQHLFDIWMLEPRWVVDHLDQLFPASSPRLADAAWQTCFVYGRRFNKSILRDLRPQYERAVDSIGTAPPLYRDYPSQLGSYLLYQYFDGVEELGPGSLLDRFFRNADVDTRTRIVSFIPHHVDEFAQQGEQPPIERAMAFWSWRVATSKDGADLRGFGLWMPSHRFDPVWRLTQLKLAIDRGGVPLHEHAVIGALPSLAALHPTLVLDCIASLIQQAGSYMQIYRFTYRGEVEAILRDALASDKTSVRTTACELVNTLIARGFTKLLALLEQSPPADDRL